MQIPEKLVRIVRSAQHITVLTGAGISADSGIPTFREAQTGLWSNYNPEDLATPKAFTTNPKLVWEWYQWRRTIISEAEPNPGHKALASMERIITTRASQFTLITQNVDGQHQRAGSQNIIELHGNINRNKCFDCDTVAEYDFHRKDEHSLCSHCGVLLRPDVVWFGESLPHLSFETALDAAKECDIFFSVGTSVWVQPAASLPMIALQTGTTFVEINPNTTQISTLATYNMTGPSGEVLPRLVEKVWPRAA